MHGMEGYRIDCIYVIAITMALEGEVFALLVILHMLHCHSALYGPDHIALAIWEASDTPAAPSGRQQTEGHECSGTPHSCKAHAGGYRVWNFSGDCSCL